MGDGARREAEAATQGKRRWWRHAGADRAQQARSSSSAPAAAAAAKSSPRSDLFFGGPQAELRHRQIYVLRLYMISFIQ
jgi:hypothetical protein